MDNAIYVVLLGLTPGPAETEALSPLTRRLAALFGCDVELLYRTVDPSSALDRSRQQHNAIVVLEQLAALSLPPVARRLGVTEHDLFIPMLTYVFGLAQLGGTAAVVSTHRLGDGLEQKAAADERVARRLEKEAVHELGHAFGLVHCAGPECVMHGATDVMEIDLRPSWFCHRCHGHLSQRQRCDPDR